MLNLKNGNDEQEDDLAEGESKQLKSAISESFECSSSDSVRAGHNQELPSIKLTDNDDIIIEEMYVDDWMSIANLNIPTDDMTEAVIGDLSGCFDFGAEHKVDGEKMQRYNAKQYDIL